MSSGPTPAPHPVVPFVFPSGTEARVCQDIAQRQAMGHSKYGTTVEANPLSLLQWHRHAYEEALDLAIYWRRLIEAYEAKHPPPQPTPSMPKPRAFESAEG